MNAAIDRLQRQPGSASPDLPVYPPGPEAPLDGEREIGGDVTVQRSGFDIRRYGIGQLDRYPAVHGVKRQLVGPGGALYGRANRSIDGLRFSQAGRGDLDTAVHRV